MAIRTGSAGNGWRDRVGAGGFGLLVAMKKLAMMLPTDPEKRFEAPLADRKPRASHPVKNLVRFLVFSFLLAGASLVVPTYGIDLTLDQLGNISKQIADLKEVIEKQKSERSQSAWSVFKQASQDPKAATDLFLKCHRLVDFEREGREEKDYKEWEDKQTDRLRDENFLRSLMLQLSYLALTCQALETNDTAAVLPALLTHVESLTRLEEPPAQGLLQGVGNSIFARAYQVEDLIQSAKNWCDVPYDIAQIYEKTILPYLRKEKPEQLMAAWDRRIAQETAVVQFLAEQATRGRNRDERKESEEEIRRMQAGKSGQILRAYHQEDFEKVTLPQLQWGRLLDMFRYVDQTQAMTAMLSFLKANLDKDDAANWLGQIAGLVGEAKGAAESSLPLTPAPGSTPPPPVGGGTGEAKGGIFNKFDR